MNAIIKIPEVLLSPFKGQQNSTLFDLATTAKVYGAESYTSLQADHVVYYVRPSLIPFNVVQLVVDNGGEVENYPMFIKIADPDGLTPVGLKDSKKEDDSQKTWNEWKKDNYTFSEADDDGFVYLGTNANNGEDLKGSEMVVIFNDVIEPSAYKLLFAED